MFYPGQDVWFLYTAPRGWNETMRVPARIAGVKAKKVLVHAKMARGGYEPVWVKMSKIIPCPTPQQVINELMVMG